MKHISDNHYKTCVICVNSNFIAFLFSVQRHDDEGAGAGVGPAPRLQDPTETLPGDARGHHLVSTRGRLQQETREKTQL